MDPSSRLDHALFQLTPTRTRCDLVIVAGGVSERLASGLLEPFLSHLKSAKDQISKGGYSVTLRPINAHAPWFTKATLQRFVRFVSTPEVLERFVTIEKEIVQIENSILSSEKSNAGAEAEAGNASSADGSLKMSTASSKLNDELTGTNHAGNEENSRVHLQRVLDNRKAVLCKEQAMAYARALVAGYDPNSVDDLICFADAFGGSRLREACINFLDLCKQKNEDKLWIDEIAAMQSCPPELPYLRTSGIILASEDDHSNRVNGLVDASFSESTMSHTSLDIGQDNSLPTPARTPSADGKAQIPMSWTNHFPQYIHNFHGAGFQQMPPYQGYLYPGMQVPSSYYPGIMQWPPNVEDSHVVLDRELDYHKSSIKKHKKKKHSQSQEDSEDVVSTASTDSSSESDLDEHSSHGKKSSSTENLHKKKHGKKSSRKVVIRNINYITSNGDGEKSSISEGSLSNEEELVNGDSLKQQVEEAVMSLERKHKSTSHRHKKQYGAKHHGTLNGSAETNSSGIKGNNNWDAFQNLLLREDKSSLGTETQPMKFQEEHPVKKNFEDGRSIALNHQGDDTKAQVVSNDSFVVTERKLESGGQNYIEHFKEGKDAPPIMKRKEIPDEELLFLQRNEESGNYSGSTLSGSGIESSLTKCQKEEEWFIIGQSDKPANEDGYKNFSMFNGVSMSSSASDSFHVEKMKKDILVDDSFMVQDRSSENHFNSCSAADISLVSDIGAAEFAKTAQEGSSNKIEPQNSHEPDDLFMVLDRDSAADQSVTPLTMEMDYENNISSKEANRKLSDVETDQKQLSNGEGTDKKTPGVRNGKVSSKEAKSKALSASIGKSKSDIMSRNKASPGSKTTVMKSKNEKEEESRKRKEELLIQRQKRIAERSASKKTGTEAKTSLTSAKKEKAKTNLSNEEIKKLPKPLLRNSTIERLATKVSPIQTKSAPAKKSSLKANGVPSQKTVGTEKKKQGPKEVKSLNQKEDTKKTNGPLPFDSNAPAKKEMEQASVVLPVNSGALLSVEPNDNNIGLKDTRELCRTPSEKNKRHLISEREYVHENVGQLDMDSCMPSQDQAGGNLPRGEELLNKLSSLPGDDKLQRSADVILNPTAALPTKPITVSAVTFKGNQEIEETVAFSAKFPEKEISTPPPTDRAMPETIHSRKKWNSDEDSSKAAKGFRKLLFFGRRS